MQTENDSKTIFDFYWLGAYDHWESQVKKKTNYFLFWDTNDSAVVKRSIV